MEKGQAVISQIIPAIVIPLLLIVAVLVFANFEGNIDTSDLSSDAEVAVNATRDNTYAGLNLASILPLVIFAAAIISVIVGAFLIFGRR